MSYFEMMLQRAALLTLVLIFLPACVPRKKAFLRGNRESKGDVLVETIELQEAKLVDLPIPLNAKPIPADFWVDGESSNRMLGYHVATTKEELLCFCIAEMERLGWEQTIYCDAVEGVILFERPGRFCIVSARSMQQGVHMIIFTGTKGIC